MSKTHEQMIEDALRLMRSRKQRRDIAESEFKRLAASYQEALANYQAVLSFRPKDFVDDAR